MSTISLDDITTKKAGSGESIMSVYRETLQKLLGEVERSDRFKVAVGTKAVYAVPFGGVANALSKLFAHLPKTARYQRSYRYLRQMEGSLAKWGWTTIEVDGRLHLVKPLNTSTPQATPVEAETQTPVSVDVEDLA